MKLCECGCGTEVVSEKARFITGHNTRVKKPILNDEQKKSKSDKMKLRWSNLEYKSRVSKKIKDVKNTPEQLIKLSLAGKLGAAKCAKLMQIDEEFKCKRIESCVKAANISWDKDHKENMLAIRKTQWTEHVRSKMSKSSKKRFENPVELEKLSKRGLLRFSNPEERNKQSKIITEAYLRLGNFTTGKYKTGYFKRKNGRVEFFQSSYEERFMKILDQNFESWSRNYKRFEYHFTDKLIKNYVPDFQCCDYKYIFETKGWLNEECLNKMILASKENNLKIFLIYENELNYLKNNPFSFDIFQYIQNGEYNDIRR